jgi:hypothetical protein
MPANIYTALRAKLPSEGVDPKPVAELSPNRIAALGLGDNLAGQYLLTRQPGLFQGVGNATDYQKTLTTSLRQLQDGIAAGKYLNTGINTRPYEAQYGRTLTPMEEKSKLGQFKTMQKQVQLEWLDYLAEGGYAPEVQLLLLGSIVKETAQQREGAWKFLSLGKNSERLPERVSPELAGRFAAEVLQPENWGKRPAQILGEVSMQLELESRERRTVVPSDVQLGGESLQWVKFPSKSNDPDNFAENVQALTALAKTSGHFGYCTWCTGTGAASGQLAMGDFWVGVDDQGKARVAVRLQGANIGEVRGVLPGQNLEPKYASQTLDLISREDLKGGDKFVADARIKGTLAEMPHPPTWEAYKQALGLDTDEEALHLSFNYESPSYQRNKRGLPFDSARGELLQLVYAKAKEMEYPAPVTHLAGVGESWVAEFITSDHLLAEVEDPKENLLRQFIRAGNFPYISHLVTPDMLAQSGGVEEAFLSNRVKDVEAKLSAEMLMPDPEWFKRHERLGDKKPLWQTSMRAGTFSEYRRVYMHLNGEGAKEQLDDLLHWGLQTEYGPINGVMYAGTQGCLSEVRDLLRPADYEQKDKNLRNLCHYAFAFGEVDCIDPTRPEIWHSDDQRRLPHHYGLRHGWYEKIKPFCTPMAMSWRDAERKTPLHFVEHILPSHWADQKSNPRWEELKNRCVRQWDKEYDLLTDDIKKMVDASGQTPVEAAVRRGDGAKMKPDADNARWRVKDESNPIFAQVVYGRSLDPVKEHLTRSNLIGSAALTAIVRSPDMLRQVMPVLDEEVLTTPCLDSTGKLGTFPVFEIARAGMLDKVLHMVDEQAMGLQDAYGDRLIHCVVGGRDPEAVDKVLGKMADKGLLTMEVMSLRDGQNRTPEEVARQFQNLKWLEKHVPERSEDLTVDI